MTKFRKDLVLPLGFMIAAAIVLVGHEATAKRSNYAAPATHVATVDLSKLFDRIELNSSWEMQLSTLTDNLNAEASARQEALAKKIESSESAADEEEKQNIRDQAALMKLELDEWAKLKQMEVDRERALMWRSMYRAIREQVTALATTDGWDIVLVNDSLGQLSMSDQVQTPKEQQILTQILNRRMLYASEMTDITEQLIVRINNLKP
jgi:Skp family chaperone for outer membrane proteins